MNNKFYAAIDIGSNAVRLLIKRVSVQEDTGEARFTKEILLRVPIRLGFDVFSKGRISKEKEKRLFRLMKAYKQLIKIYDVAYLRACATSAMRDAENSEKIIRKIRRRTGIPIEVLNGQEEARMVYKNHIEFVGDREGYYMYVDVGGGSTEVSLLSNGELLYSKSFNIGTVRILTGGVDEADWLHLKSELSIRTKGLDAVDIIGSGGNINKIYRLIDDKDRKLKRVRVSDVSAMYEKLRPLSTEERMEAFNLMPDRADVIVPAMDIFLTIAETVNSSFIYVPEIGLADGIIDALYENNASMAKEI